MFIASAPVVAFVIVVLHLLAVFLLHLVCSSDICFHYLKKCNKSFISSIYVVNPIKESFSSKRLTNYKFLGGILLKKYITLFFLVEIKVTSHQ